MKKTVELLEIRPKTLKFFEETIDYVIKTDLQELVAELLSSPTPWCFGAIGTRCMYTVIGSHLQLIDARSARTCADKGVEFGKKYFLEKWYGDSPGKKAPKELRKSPQNKELKWSDQFRDTLLLSFLVREFDSVQQLSAWPEAWMRLDLSDDDPLWGVILVSIAAEFRDSPMKGIEEAEDAVLKGRGKGPKLCMQAWIAARSGDGATFEKHFTKAVEHFEKTAIEPQFPNDLIAIYPSLVLAAGRCKGMKVPDLESRLLARLLTPESVGFT